MNHFAGATTHVTHVLNQCQRLHLFDDGATFSQSQGIKYVSFFPLTRQPEWIWVVLSTVKESENLGQ